MPLFESFAVRRARYGRARWLRLLAVTRTIEGMPRFLFLCALLASTIPAAELPKRFLLGTPVPIILKDVQPAKFLEAVGRRSALLGR